MENMVIVTPGWSLHVPLFFKDGPPAAVRFSLNAKRPEDIVRQ